MVGAGGAYVVAELGGESFWKSVAGLLLSVCGVLFMLLYQDMKREQREAAAERQKLREMLDKKRR